MNNNFKLLDWITLISFGIGLYALYIALENLEENRDQNDELKEILHYLDTHLQDQDKHLHEQDKHLASQDRILENLTKQKGEKMEYEERVCEFKKYAKQTLDLMVDSYKWKQMAMDCDSEEMKEKYMNVSNTLFDLFMVEHNNIGQMFKEEQGAFGTLLFLWYNYIGDFMTIAIDKSCVDIVSFDDNKYVYLFDDESYEELSKLNLHCVYYKNCKFVDINLTDYDIDCIKKCKATDKDWNKLPPKIDYKIGIIIPNYNYEHTLKKCLSSILEQTYKNYEIIFVDDMSTDNSVNIVRKIATKHFPDLSIKIKQLKQKRYNGGARNEAYLHLSDDVDYVYYIDSDDWLYDNKALEKINNKLQKKPDVLFVGMANYKNDKTTTCFIPQYKDKYEAIQGWSGSCGKVIKKKLATRQECLYNEGTLKEDKNQHCKICIYMNSFELLKEPVYVWNQDNNKSVTTIRDKVIWGTSTIRHYADTLQLALSVKGKDQKIDNILNERIRMTKQEMDMGNDRQW